MNKQAHITNKAASASKNAPAAGSILQRQCACGQHTIAGGECEKCGEKRLQRRTDKHPAPPAVPPAVHNTLSSPGQSLDPATRAFMEPRFNHDFSRVRVHTDAKAAESAQSVNALAYTVGSNLVFAHGQYQPQTLEGKRLLAHELTHVIQQRGVGQNACAQASLRVSERDDPAEREADAMAERIIALPTAQALAPSFHVTPSPFTPIAAPALSWPASPRLKTSFEKFGGGGMKANQATLSRTQNTGIYRKAAQVEDTTEDSDDDVYCSSEDEDVIIEASERALESINKAIPQLDAFLAKPNDAGSKAARDALTALFRNATTKVATFVLGQLNRLRSDLKNLALFVFQCPGSEQDKMCQPNVAEAYVPKDNKKMVVFCDSFFEDDSISRSEVLVHELAHAAVGGSVSITDRSYKADRALKLLTTEEALTNAETYRLFVRQLATGKASPSEAPVDTYQDCPDDWKPALEKAIATAQRWNREAQVYLVKLGPKKLTDEEGKLIGGKTQADIDSILAAVNKLAKRLDSPINFQCEKEGDCEDDALTYWYPFLSDFHICSKWSKEKPEAQALFLLQGLYGYAAGVSDAVQRLFYARFAQKRKKEAAPALSTITGSAAWNADYLRIMFYPIQLTPADSKAGLLKEYIESGSLHQRMSKDAPKFQAPPCQTTKLNFVFSLLFMVDEESVPRPTPFTPPSVKAQLKYMTPNGERVQHEQDPHAYYNKPGSSLDTQLPPGFGNVDFTRNGQFQMRFELQDPDTGITRLYEDTIQVEPERPCNPPKGGKK